jgi:predicted nicotinamide N-methyase
MDTITKSSDGFLPETPLDAVAERVRETIRVGGRNFIISRPADADRLMDHPAVHAAFAADEYMPYWTDLWPGARIMAEVIAKEKWRPGLEVLELGCGLGLPGLVALSLGLQVMFSDYDATALRFAAENARLNGFSNFRLLQLDWRCPPPNMCFALILAADLTYEMRNVEPLVALIKTMLRPDGTCLLTDPDRAPARLLRDTLEKVGLRYTATIAHAGEHEGDQIGGTLYRITRPD